MRTCQNVDALLATIDRFFACDKLAGTAQCAKALTVHRICFRADTAHERWKLFMKFLKMAITVLKTGKTELRFKER